MHGRTFRPIRLVRVIIFVCGCGNEGMWFFFGANMTDCWGGCGDLAARSALKRKKQHEHSLEQTNGQINMLEQQIYSIESANINQETLLAMKNASSAMKQIHGKMTMDDVDVTMCVLFTLNHLSVHSLCHTPLCHRSSNEEDEKESHTMSFFLGNNSANNTSSRKKLATQSRRCRLRNRSTKTSYRPTWIN